VVVSVIVPAHNEESMILRLLDALVPDEVADTEVIVVCNGCADGTAEVVRQFGRGVVVLETPVPSKMHALDCGNALAAGFPRVYVDADVQMTRASLRRLCEALDARKALAAGPGRILDTRGASWAVREYYRVWQQLPAVQNGLWGRGAIALSHQGFRRAVALPEVMSDDLAMGLLFRENERTIVEDAEAHISIPRDLGSLLKRRRRIVTGNHQLETLGIDPSGAQTALHDIVMVALRSPRLLPGIVVLVGVAVAARVVSFRDRRRGYFSGWHRDDSSRAQSEVVG
jgi:glycosyltransferase involved in cell wall biosynthesis